MNNQETHKLEDRQNKLCKDPENDNTQDYSKEISRMISMTLKKGNQVYCTTDWHLWLHNTDNDGCHKRSDFDTIINNMKETIKDDDMLINLGDLVDGEFTDRETLKQILLEIPGKKILIRGNNDIFSYNFYRSCGFKYVTRSFTWSNNIFTHVPIENDKSINIHGHIHGYHTYWIPYTNQIDVAYLDGRKKPVKLIDIINSQQRYSKIIKEQPQHFDESASLFEYAMKQYLDLFHAFKDPFPDYDYLHD